MFLLGFALAAAAGFMLKRPLVETRYVPATGGGTVTCAADGSSYWSGIHFEVQTLSREEFQRKLDDFCRPPAVRNAI
jgi:hypothetical protein